MFKDASPAKKSGSKFKALRSVCLKIKFEYVCAFGTAHDQKLAQDELDAFSKTASATDRQVVPDSSVDKGVELPEI